MKLKKTLIPLAASLLALAACGGTETSSPASSSADPIAAAAQTAVSRLGGVLQDQGQPGLYDRTFEIQNTITVDDYTFDLSYTIEQNADYVVEGCDAVVFSAENTIATAMGNSEYFLATSSNYDTISPTGTGSLSDYGRFAAHLYTVEPTEATDAGVALSEGTFKIGFYQRTLGKWFYLNGLMDDRYYDTTEAFADAADFTVAAMEGGYSIKIAKMGAGTETDNTGKYLAMHLVDEKYNNLTIADEAWAWYATDDHTYVVTTSTEQTPDTGDGPAVFTLKGSVSYEGTELATGHWNIRIDLLKITALKDVPSLPSGSTLITYGIYTGGYNSGDYSHSRYHWVANGDAGMTLYGAVDSKIKVGDILKISGEYSPYSGLPEIAPTAVEVVDPKTDANAAAVQEAVTINYTGQELTSSMISLPIVATGEIASGSAGAEKYDFTLKISDTVSIELYGENDKDGKEGFAAMSTVKVGDKVTINGWLGNHNGKYQIIACHPTAATAE